MTIFQAMNKATIICLIDINFSALLVTITQPTRCWFLGFQSTGDQLSFYLVSAVMELWTKLKNFSIRIVFFSVTFDKHFFFSQLSFK